MSILTKIEWPTINTILELLTPHHPDWLASRLEDINDSILTVAAPSTLSIPVLYSNVGEPVTIQWIHHRGLCDVMGTVLATERDPLPLWIIKANGEPTLHQRRSFARLAVTLPVVIASENGPKNIVTTLDISEGGMSCVLGGSESIQPGDRVETIVSVDNKPFRTIAVVVRTAVDSKGQPIGSFRFDDLSPRDADRVRRFIFNEQLRLRSLDRTR